MQAVDSSKGDSKSISRFEIGDRSAVGLLALALFLSFPFVFLGMETFVLRDFASFGYPLAAHLKQSLLSGEIPHWNPLSSCGLPFLAQWNTMVCYPGSILLFVGPLSFSLGFFCLLHLLLGGVGMYQLTRVWNDSPAAGLVAAAAYMFNGLVLNSLMWPNNIAAFGWLPWVVLAAGHAIAHGRRPIVIAILVGSLQMLTGAPEVILFTWMIIGAIQISGLFPNSSGEPRVSIGTSALRFVGIVVGVALVCAVQLLPFYEMLSLSQRGGADYDDSWAVSKWVWVNLIVPLFRTQRIADGSLYMENQAWTHSFYPGVVVWVLAFCAVLRRRDRRIVILAGLTIAAVVCSLGRKGFLFSLFESLVPLGFMRFPVKLLIVCSIALPILAAFGYRTLFEAEESDGNRALKWSAALVAGWLGLAAMAIASGPLAPDPATIWSNLGSRVAILIAAVFLLWKFRKAGAGAAPAILVAGLVAIDGSAHHPTLVPSVPRAFWSEELPPLGFESETRPGEQRAAVTVGVQNLFYEHVVPDMGLGLVGKRMALLANLNLPRGIPKVNGFYSLYFPQTHDIEDKLYTGPASFNTNIADALSISQALVYTGELVWYARPTALPWVSIGQEPVFLPVSEVLDQVAASEFRPAETVCLSERSGESAAAKRDVSARIHKLGFGNHRIEFETETAESTMVVLSQNFHPSWRAQVDGEPVPLLRANHAFQAVAVPAGNHRVTLYYATDAFRRGIWLTSVTLVLLIALWLCWGRKQKVA